MQELFEFDFCALLPLPFDVDVGRFAWSSFLFTLRRLGSFYLGGVPYRSRVGVLESASLFGRLVFEPA